MDPWTAINAASFITTDSNYVKVLAAKKALKLLSKNSDLLVKLCIACSDNDSFSVKDILGENSLILNKLDNQGLTPLIYAICFNNKECVEILLSFHVDCNEQDKLIGWTPIMWATHFDYEGIVERLLAFDADPLKKSNKTMKNAVDISKPNSKVYEFFKIHNYLNDPAKKCTNDGSFFKEDTSPQNNDINNTLNAQLSIQTSGINNMASASNDKTNIESKFIDDNDEGYEFPFEYVNFDFNNVLPKQCIAFTDDSIGGIIDYVFKLQSKYHNKPIYPASIIFQCMRYAESKLGNSEMVQNLFDIFSTRVRSVTGTKSGVVQLNVEKKDKKSKKNHGSQPSQSVDIVTIGYWIASLNHLYYFISRDAACEFFPKYPQLLQDLVSSLQPLISQLAFSLDERLEPLLQPCILEYNSVPDMDIVYKNDWKLFRNKNKSTKKSSYEEILDMLYPPSLNAQMKPSPLKVIQTLGALLYVLELYHINDVIKQQCFSAVLYWLGTSLFNKVLSNKRYCSRVKSMEIRLNLSYIQDWIRTNNLVPFIGEGEDIMNWKDNGFPDSIVSKSKGWLKNVTRFEGDALDPLDATYYFNPLYRIGQLSLQPIIELAEWLQVMTGIEDVSGLEDISGNFDCLSSMQMVQCIRNYHYEVNEKKFSKSLKKHLKENVTLSSRNCFYADEDKIFFNFGQVFPVTLPNPVQLLHQYGADFKHVDSKKLKLFQPTIPIEIQDDIDLIVDQYADQQEGDNTTEEEEQDSGAERNSLEVKEGESPLDEKENNTVVFDKENKNDNSDLFRELSVPSTIAHKTWNEGENPWA